MRDTMAFASAHAHKMAQPIPPPESATVRGQIVVLTGNINALFDAATRLEGLADEITGAGAEKEGSVDVLMSSAGLCGDLERKNRDLAKLLDRLNHAVARISAHYG